MRAVACVCAEVARVSCGAVCMFVLQSSQGLSPPQGRYLIYLSLRYKTKPQGIFNCAALPHTASPLIEPVTEKSTLFVLSSHVAYNDS